MHYYDLTHDSKSFADELMPSQDMYPFRLRIDFPPFAPKNLVGLILGPKGLF
jgi:hypothetical protein